VWRGGGPKDEKVLSSASSNRDMNDGRKTEKAFLEGQNGERIESLSGRGRSTEGENRKLASSVGRALNVRGSLQARDELGRRTRGLCVSD